MAADDRARQVIRHIELKEANEFVAAIHRHHAPVRGHRFSICSMLGDQIVGVAIVGRPVSRMIDHHCTVEVLRLCTDGTPNCCSHLLGACRRAAKALGYRKIITYTLAEEPGTSQIAAGWQFSHMTQGGSWDTPTRHRADRHPTMPKKLYYVDIDDH